MRRAAVAEDGALAARQHGSHLSRMRRLGAVTDQIDAAMQSVKSPVTQP
jgi:hypothetical protein